MTADIFCRKQSQSVKRFAMWINIKIKNYLKRTDSSRDHSVRDIYV